MPQRAVCPTCGAIGETELNPYYGERLAMPRFILHCPNCGDVGYSEPGPDPRLGQ